MLGKIEGRRRRGKTEDKVVGWYHQLSIVAAHSMQWAGPGLSTGSHVEWKEGLPPHTHTTPTVDSLVTRNGPRNKNQTNQRSPDDSP